MTDRELFQQTNPSEPVTDPARLRESLLRRLNRRTPGKAELVFPCVPALLENYLERLKVMAVGLGQPLSEKHVLSLRQVMGKKLTIGFEASPYSRLVVRLDSFRRSEHPDTRLAVSMNLRILPVQSHYQYWVNTRKPPLFGAHPDAKILAVAKDLGNPVSAPILDVGAGPGRNAIPLARLGHPVHAVELTPVFVQQLQTAATPHHLPITVVAGDILDRQVELPAAHFQLAIASEVTSHFRHLAQLEFLLQRLTEAVAKGGLVLFNVFLAIGGFEPDLLMRQLSEVLWCTLFTREELGRALASLPLEIVSDEPAYEYEREHLPAEAWPPTGWFPVWATGRDLFPMAARPPVELRWLLCRRR